MEKIELLQKNEVEVDVDVAVIEELDNWWSQYIPNPLPPLPDGFKTPNMTHSSSKSEIRHWEWRAAIAIELSIQLDFEKFGIRQIYLYGGVSLGKAGPYSDIDLIIHIADPEDKKLPKEFLCDLISDIDKQIIATYQDRTGIDIPDLLSVKIITDDDIVNKRGVAGQLTSRYSIPPIELPKRASEARNIKWCDAWHQA